ncbi:hypothetical protein [Amycolatopsis sp. FDAARGOS 1241]|uniref:hypothetical protein n=1 Tax=Amycolatopsis sp. FDAARGOS 1241 TaxID=2778070 RepID=UPI001951C392|nr:hypothetical protein [Amycolatopsis sp. FDAARGOS 1241]QRP46037.1 hypothetical protein I6J71_44490 [Amycolatopsis sp. FDAARGOS 1241]
MGDHPWHARNKPTDEQLTERHGMTAEQWRHAKAQTKAGGDAASDQTSNEVTSDA